jgi:hypothetical protein
MDHKTVVSWPQTSANIAADDSTLPVPDPSAFEPDTLPSEDTADVVMFSFVKGLSGKLTLSD